MISKLNFFIGFICCHLLSFLHLVSIEEVEPIGSVNDVRAFLNPFCGVSTHDGIGGEVCKVIIACENKAARE